MKGVAAGSGSTVGVAAGSVAAGTAGADTAGADTAGADTAGAGPAGVGSAGAVTGIEGRGSKISNACTRFDCIALTTASITRKETSTFVPDDSQI